MGCGYSDNLHTPVPYTVFHEKFQFLGGGVRVILCKIRTEALKSSMKNSNSREGVGVFLVDSELKS